MRKIFHISIILFLTLILLPPDVVQAEEHKLEDLYIHTYLHSDGSATIKEVRKAHLIEGTESYDVIENLGQSEITDFTVTEDGVTYDFIDPWDINASREEKAYKNGIIKTANGYEIAWGIGEYGYHEYELEYTVTNFIKQLKDSQVLFWRFVNDMTNIPPENLTIEIEADHELTEAEERIWGFGFEGDIHFEDGKVVARSSSPLTRDEYGTVLIKFKDDLFATEDQISKSFEEIKDEAFAGSEYETGGNQPNPPSTSSPFDDKFFFIVFIIGFLPFIIIGVFFIVLISLIVKSWNKRKKYKGEYEREIPYDQSFINLYRLLEEIDLTKFEHLLSAILLKWIKEDNITIDEQETGFIFKWDEPVIYLSKSENITDPLEYELFQMLKEAAGTDYELETKEMTAWTKKNRRRIRKWKRDVKMHSLECLIEEGIVLERNRGLFTFFRKPYEKTATSDQLEKRVYTFSNYLEDYSLLNEHESINVKLWDDYMIWAAYLGIADKVYKEFKKLYPQIERDSVYTHSMITLSSTFSGSVSSASSYSSSGSSGGGGSIGGGGGGGSFGGGSGGGTR